MPATIICPFTPSYGMEKGHEPRVIESRLGDGYTQQVLQGINNLPVEMKADFLARTDAEARQIEAFFKSLGGVTPFLMDLPGEDWSVTAGGFGVGDGTRTQFQLQRTALGSVATDDWSGAWPAYTTPRTNLCLQNLDFTQAVWTKASLTDNGAAVDLAGSLQAREYTALSAGATITQTISGLVAGQTYTASIYLSCAAGTTLKIGTTEGAGASLTLSSATQRATLTFVAASTSTVLTIGAGASWLSGARIRVFMPQVEMGSTATKPVSTAASAVTVTPLYWPQTGGGFEPVTNFSLSSPPQIYRQDWQGNKLLYQTPRTNFLLWSEDISNPAWLKAPSGTGTAPSVTSNYGTAPDGNGTADRLQCSQGTGAASTDYSILFSNNVVSTSGLYYEADFFIKTTDGSVQTVYCTVAGTNCLGTLLIIDGNWRRVSVPWLISSGSNIALRLGVRGGYTPANATCDLLFWGATLYRQTDPAPKYKIAAEGDSITFGNYSLGWPSLINLPSGSSITNNAVSGSTTSSMVARFDSYKNGGYSHFAILGGINDIRQDVGLVTIQSNLAYMWETAKSLGMTVVAMTTTPFKGDTSTWNSTRQANQDALNAWIRQQTEEKGYLLVDLYAMMQDPSNQNYLLPAYDGGDGIHPGLAGETMIAYAVRAAFDGDRAASYIPTSTTPVTVTDYTVSNRGLVTFAAAPLNNAVLTFTASGPTRHQFIAKNWKRGWDTAGRNRVTVTLQEDFS